VKIDEGQQKIKIVRGTQKIKSSAPTDNQIYAVPANQISPCLGTTLILAALTRKCVIKFSGDCPLPSTPNPAQGEGAECERVAI